MKGWMSWVTASSPAMNCAHSRVAESRSRSVSDSQSARSREKSMSAGSQNFALPPANNLNGRLFQLSPPAPSEPSRVRVISIDLLLALTVGQIGEAQRFLGSVATGIACTYRHDTPTRRA